MAAIDEVTEAEIWLRATLLAHTGVTSVFGSNVYTHPGPRNASYPKLTYNLLAPSDDTMLVGTDTWWANLRFLIRGIIEGDDRLTITDGIAAVKDAIHGKTGVTTNAQIVSCVRLRPFQMFEMQDSKAYLHLGGEYKLQVRSLT